tara:strand:+ start:300 stop:554 length:255 start_codon:yes stop_codon:yes gene_type:complete
MSSSIISTRIAELISFTKEKTVANITESVSKGDITVSDDDLSKLASLIDLSISQAFTIGYSNVDSAVSDFVNDTEKKFRKKPGY